MNLRPLHNKVIVQQREADEVSKGGIVLAGTKEKPLKGDVLAVGPGIHLETGEFIETTVQVGDVVLFGTRVGEEVQIDEHEILAIVEE